jgi:hypothetical protein
MKREILVLIVTAMGLAQAVSAGEPQTIERKETVVCTSSDGSISNRTSGQNGQFVVQTDDNYGQDIGDDVNVQVFNDGNGEEKRVIVVRRVQHDNADANKDGMITRREFMSKAEKRFAELDRNRDGVLSKEEAQPPLPPLPPLPPMAPVPPIPPVPPVPPAN